MSLLVSSLLSRADLLRHLYSFPSVDQFILYLLLEAQDAQIRTLAAEGFYRLCCVPSTLRYSIINIYLPPLNKLSSFFHHLNRPN